MHRAFDGWVLIGAQVRRLQASTAIDLGTTFSIVSLNPATALTRNLLFNALFGF